jgi:tetratricopeptide (TPR) repeat protein
MTRDEVEQKFADCSKLVLEHRLNEAFLLLAGLLAKAHIADLSLQLEELKLTYRNLLDYTFRGVRDPQRSRIYKSLTVSILELADKIKQDALVHSGTRTQLMKREMEKVVETARDETSRNISEIDFHQELADSLFGNSLKGKPRRPADRTVIIPALVFNFIWLSDKYTEADIELIQTIRTSASLPWHQKSLVVSAVTLSALSCFDEEKFLILCDFYKDREQGTWQRAFTGLIVMLYRYSGREVLYPRIMQRLEIYAGDDRFGRDFERLFVQLIKAKGTETVTQKFREEIMPDIAKIESKLKEKLDIDNLLPDDYSEDKNPNWEILFSDSPGLLEKIEQMSELQMNGHDLFMGTFSMLKHFDFFNEISNWFQPFFRENEALLSAMPTDEDFDREAFLDGLQNAFYMCDSDKYSFGLNIRSLPAEQRKFMAGMFSMEAGNLKDISDEERLLNKPEAEAHAFTQYIQDLYRFYKLHPIRDEFNDLFNSPWNIQSANFFEVALPFPSIKRRIGEFLFEQEYLDHALDIFSSLLAHSEALDQDIYEKTAYIYQRKGNFKEALGYYLKAELFGTNRMWNIKKIIYCYRKLKDSANALEWCLEASRTDPSDIYIHTQAGNCYLDLLIFDKALEHYFKVEFLAPDNKKVLRPIAWCAFAKGKLDIASNYSNAILQSDPGAHDYINAGHLSLCLGDKPMAINWYKKSLETKEISFVEFISVFSHDSSYLVSNGAVEEELPLLLDYLREISPE